MATEPHSARLARAIAAACWTGEYGTCGAVMPDVAALAREHEVPDDVVVHVLRALAIEGVVHHDGDAWHVPDNPAAQARRALDTAALTHARDAQDRMRDAAAATDQARHERDAAIRALLRQGWSLRAIAEQLGLSWSAVRYIAHQEP